MAEDYSVNYQINVQSQAALESIRAFSKAVQDLDAITTKFKKIGGQVNRVNNAFAKLGKSHTVTVNTSTAEKNLDRLLGKIESIQRASSNMSAINISGSVQQSGGQSIVTNGSGSGTQIMADIDKHKPTHKNKPGSENNGNNGNSGESNQANANKPANKPVTLAKRRNAGKLINSPATAYNVFGPSMLDSGGFGAVNMAKGMGISYGLMGVMSGMSSALKDAVDYDNISQTTKNILSTHDKMPNFDSRFQEMSQTIRNVGVETKYTAPEVASAGKFLAMAGFNIDDINKAIRPISDLALIGDTDLGQTADVTTNIMSGYDIVAGKMDKVADVMTMTFTKSNTTLMDLAESYKYSASILSLAGVQFEHSAAALGVLGDAGIKGSQAGTTMRSLVANILKPTKSQGMAWERLGVERTDKQGNIRPMNEIFGDLKDKGATAKDMYSLFHKTAAAGAGALMSHVDKWNEIIRLNFLSDGLAKRLAEEKKNTISGLWEQLTSAFTEDGMIVFETFQERIKVILKDAIEYIKSPEIISTINNLANTIMSLGETLVGFGKTVMAIYNFMPGVFDTLVKAQLYTGLFLVPLRALRAMMSGGSWVLSFVTRFVFGIKKMVAVTQELKGSKHIISAIPSAWKKAEETVGTVAQKFSISSFLIKAGSVVMAAALSPIGIACIGAAAAIGVVSYAIYNFNQQALAVDGLQKVLKTYDMVNGIDMSSGAKGIDRYLQVVYDKQNNLTTSLEKYLKLRREEMMLNSTVMSDEEKKAPALSIPGLKEGTEYFETIDNPLLDAGYYDSAAGYKAIINSGYNTLTGADKSFINGPLKEDNKSFGEIYTSQFAAGPKRTVNRITSEAFVGRLGYMSDQGKQLAEKYSSEYMAASSPSEKDMVRFRWKKFAEDLKNKGTKDVIPEIDDMDEEGLTVGDFVDTKAWNRGLSQILSEAIDPKSHHYVANLLQSVDNLKNMAPMQPSYQQLAEVMAKSGGPIITTLEENQSPLFFQLRGQQSYNSKDVASPMLLGPSIIDSGIGQWGAGYGFDIANKYTNHLQNNPLVGTDAWYEKFGWSSTLNRFVGTKDKPILQCLEEVRMVYAGISDWTQKTSPNLKYIGEQLLNLPIFNGLYGGDNNKGGVGGGNGRGDVEYDISTTPLPGYEYNKVTGDYRKKKVATGVVTPGASSSDYKSHYQSESATPKQIIVKISNLLNVEKVDMSDEKKAAAVMNLKDALASALIDVVSDFDNTMG